MTTFSDLYDHCYVMHYPRYVLLCTRLNHVLLTVTNFKKRFGITSH